MSSTDEDQVEQLASQLEAEWAGERGASGGNKLERLASRLNLDDESANTDRSNRAVSEQVLDPRIRMILLKMINQGIIYEINGCISTGKEANVYHARTETGEHRAIKIYKSTILCFKARDKYVTGEYRFRQGYSRSNPRKMVQVWAEKEMRNLKRLQTAGINSPAPLLLKQQVLLMEFVGDARGNAAPRLKDAEIQDQAQMERLYRQALLVIRQLYQECHLVHADLSEYNLLVHPETVDLVLIDVGQAVEHEHPHALDFLKHDCLNLLRFFRPRVHPCLSLRQLFDFVTKGDLNVEEYLAAAHAEAASLSQEVILAEEKDIEERARAHHQPANRMNEEAIFINSFVPRTLEEVRNVDRDVAMIERGGATQLSYHDLLADENKESDSEEDSTENSEDFTDSDEDSPLSKEEQKRLRKEHKKQVKEENRDRRKQKMRKKEKKRLEKKSHK